MNKNPSKLNSEYVKRYSRGQFFTDAKLMPHIFNYFGIKFTDVDILEPSCGCGNFIDAILSNNPNATIDGIDIDPNIFRKLCKKYKSSNVRLFNKDFLLYEPDKEYDLIIGNPPFNLPANKPYQNTTDAFVLKSLDLLKEGGKLVMVLPSTFLRNKQYQAARKRIINNYRIVGITESTEYDFLGADVETVVMCIEKRKPAKQKQSYSSQTKTHTEYVNLVKTSCDTIQTHNSELCEIIEKKIGITTIDHLFKVYRGRASTKNSLVGRDINFYGNYLKPVGQVTKPKIVVQNIAYRLVANISFDDDSRISDTVTILSPKKNMTAEELLVLCNYLNSSIAYYILHTKVLNFCKLTIHIDKHYIKDLPVPMPDEFDHNAFVSLDSKRNTTLIAQERNQLFYKHYQINNNQINEIEFYWSLPKCKIKEGISYEGSRAYSRRG